MTQSATEAQPKAKKNKLSSGFFRFVLTRFLLIIPTVFILVTIVFFVMRATGDPISAALGGRLTPEESSICQNLFKISILNMRKACYTAFMGL